MNGRTWTALWRRLANVNSWINRASFSASSVLVGSYGILRLINKMFPICTVYRNTWLNSTWLPPWAFSFKSPCQNSWIGDKLCSVLSGWRFHPCWNSATILDSSWDATVWRQKISTSFDGFKIPILSISLYQVLKSYGKPLKPRKRIFHLTWKYYKMVEESIRRHPSRAFRYAGYALIYQ